MNQKTKQIFIYIAFGIALFAGLMNLNVVLASLQKVIGLIFPIILGLIFAFVLNVPMTGIEHRLVKLFSKAKHKPKESLMRTMSLVLTFVSIILVIVLAGTLMVPALAESAQSIYPLIEKKWPEWVAYLEGYEINLSMITEWVEGFDLKALSTKAGTLWDSAVKAATSTISGLVNVGFGFVIAVYVLLGKDKLASQFKKLIYAHVKKQRADRIVYVATLIRDTYGKFLFGQCTEAIILGCLIFLAFSICRIPYAGLIAFLTSLLAFVPYIGAYVACAIGGFLILLAAPSKLILGICVYFTVQFIENQFIYPHVVGTSVGLSALWTLIAALIGGKLFGLPGIIFFIPFVAVLYTLVREDTEERLQERGLTEVKAENAEGSEKAENAEKAVDAEKAAEIEKSEVVEAVVGVDNVKRVENTEYVGGVESLDVAKGAENAQEESSVEHPTEEHKQSKKKRKK